ncbi:hypothetical protein L9F63_016468, partial [Diploptera punctata]
IRFLNFVTQVYFSLQNCLFPLYTVMGRAPKSLLRETWAYKVEQEYKIPAFCCAKAMA